MDQGRQDSEGVGGGGQKKESAGFPSKLKTQMTGNRQIRAGGRKRKKKELQEVALRVCMREQQARIWENICACVG